MAFAGKWKFDKSENMEKFLLAIGVAADKAKEAESIDSVVENKVEGDTFIITTTAKGRAKEQRFKLGTEFDLDLPMVGIKDKVVASVDGLTLTIKSTTDYAVTETREVKGDTMVISLSKPGVSVVGKRYLKRA